MAGHPRRPAAVHRRPGPADLLISARAERIGSVRKYRRLRPRSWSTTSPPGLAVPGPDPVTSGRERSCSTAAASC